MRDYMGMQVTPSKRVTSSTLGHPPLCKQAPKCGLGVGARVYFFYFIFIGNNITAQLTVDQ